jgi:hypothetical protein
MWSKTLRPGAATLLGAALALGALPAAAAPVFGPNTYENLSGGSDVYDETFASAEAGRFTLWVQNGDEGGGTVGGGSIVVNGQTLADDSDFDGDPLFSKRVELNAGSNSLTVTLSGDAGSFVTVMILPRGERPNVTIGRLLLPYADADALVLDLKNGSHAGGRSYRVVFYDASGHYAASSNRMLLDPRASLSQPVGTLIVEGAWTAGSIEIFYAGRGVGRLLGQATETDPISGVSSIVPIEHAGTRLLTPSDQARRRD